MFGLEGTAYTLWLWAILVLKLVAFLISLTYSSQAYAAAGKWTKAGWCTVLGTAVLLDLVFVRLPFVSLGFLIATLVYLADVRPALSGLRRR